MEHGAYVFNLDKSHSIGVHHVTSVVTWLMDDLFSTKFQIKNKRNLLFSVVNSNKIESKNKYFVFYNGRMIKNNKLNLF